MFECCNLHYQVAGKTLISGLSQRFSAGAINAIIGANGAGKSSVLKLLLGVYQPQQGQVTFCDQPLQQWSLPALATKRAYVAQSLRAALRIPVYEYLALSRTLRRESQQQRDAAVSHTLTQLNLGTLAQADLDCLSGGELQRVELARAWCQLLDASTGCVANTVLVLDEPTSALDIKQTRDLYGHLHRFTQLGGSVVLVEHDINQAAQHCDYLLMLKQGQTLVSGPTEAVFSAANINRCFDVQGHLSPASDSLRRVFQLGDVSCQPN